MASENHSDQPAASQRKQPNGSPLPELPSTPAGPPILNDGLESPRSSNC